MSFEEFLKELSGDADGYQLRLAYDRGYTDGLDKGTSERVEGIKHFKMEMEAGRVTFEMSAEFVGAITGHMANMLKKPDGGFHNFIELEGLHREAGRFALRVERFSGHSPAQILCAYREFYEAQREMENYHTLDPGSRPHSQIVSRLRKSMNAVNIVRGESIHFPEDAEDGDAMMTTEILLSCKERVAKWKGTGDTGTDPGDPFSESLKDGMPG